MTDDPHGPDGAPTDDTSAAELALGLLDGEQRAAALRRVIAEPGYARAVEGWRVRFAQLFDLWPEVEAPEGLVDRIDAGLGGPVAVRRLRFPWPALAIASSAVAAALLVFVAVRPTPLAPAPVVVAARPGPLLVASMDAKAAPVPAVFDAAADLLRIASGPETPAARVAQLWVIGGDGVPHALALLGRQAQVVTLSAADRARIAAGATLAISIEPLGGSPTGLPTGPVVAKGVLGTV